MNRAGAEAVKGAFSPVVNDRTRILVLGSLPGDASLAVAQYYAHPRNAFWPLIGEVVRRDLVTMAYPDRLEALKACRVGLWDVIATAERPGSLDGAIRNAVAADLSGLIASLPDLRAVAFNGATAAKMGRRRLAALSGQLPMIDLPSSSPAHAIPLADKHARWASLTPFLTGD